MSQSVAEVERVAQNINNALNNPETPEIVKAHIKYYVHNLVGDFTDNSEAVAILYLDACRQISQTPFIPRSEYIEALTSNDKSKSLSAIKDLEDIVLLPISEIKAKKLVIKFFDTIDIFSETHIPLIFSALIYAVASEVNIKTRSRLAAEITHQTFYETQRWSDEYRAFLEKSVKYVGKVSKGK